MRLSEMIHYTTQVQPYEAALTDEQIASQLQATGVTKRPINRAGLLDLLNKLGVLRKVVRLNESSQWQGSALAMQGAIAAAGNQQFAAAFDEWFSHITNPANDAWDTTKPQWSAPFWQMSETLADQPGMPTADDFAAIVALGGGWQYAEITAADIAESRLQHQRLEAFGAMRLKASALISKANAVVTAAKLQFDAAATPEAIIEAGELELAKNDAEELS